MALLINVSDANILGNQVNFAINQIRDGLAFFEKYDGLRAQTIGVSAATFGETFGIADPTEAQAMSDRWGSIAAGTYTGMSDFIDATLRKP